MVVIKETGTLMQKREEKRELASICNQVIESASTQGRLTQPKSMRNLRRWLRRQVIKREGISTSNNRHHLTKVASMLLMTSGLFLSGIQVAEAARTFEGRSELAIVPVNGTPAAVDINADGDIDIFSGDYQGAIFYFENAGSAASPTMTARTGVNNPFNGIDVGDDSAPTFADIDNDGDFDAFVGEDSGTVKYFENTGSAASPAFTERTGVNNPLNDVAANGRAKPVFTDIDADGDLDAFVGELSGQFSYFENTGSVGSPTFTERAGVLNPLNGIDVGDRSAVAFMDIDLDGDFDAFIGEDGSTHYFENTGSAESPTFTERTEHLNPLDDLGFTESVPTFADMNGDGDKDLLLGWSYGATDYYENIPKIVNNGTLTEQYQADNPLYGFDVGRVSTPTFADIDNDGDFDAFVGDYDGLINYFENTGSAATPTFVERTGVNNPLDAVAVTVGCCGGAYSEPTFADIDNDGDLDFFAGGYYGTIEYYENTGSAASPTFTERTGVDNPLDGLTASNYHAPTFADIDNDGDFDFFLGNSIKYYENTGSAASPTFVERTGAANPLNGFTGGADTLVDFDGDNDLDVVSGGANGTLRYIENTGSAASPTFVARTDGDNPLNGFDVAINQGWPAPAVVDIDNDGEVDVFVGEYDGTINFFHHNPAGGGGNIAPIFDSSPTISGTPEVGSTLSLINTATTDTDGDTVTLSYQWKADGLDITGATLATYTLTADESAQLITCSITADDGNSGITAAITAGVTVANSAPTFNTPPTISGTATAGETLSLTGTATSDANGDSVTLSYQWQANSVDIAGAESATYTLTANESGKSVTAIITADDGNGGSTNSTTSGVTVTQSADADDGGGGSLSWMLLLTGLIAPFRIFGKR